MADPPSGPGTGDDSGTPAWVKVAAVVALVVVVVIVLMLVFGRGGHGPGRHTHAATLADPVPASSGTQRRP